MDTTLFGTRLRRERETRGVSLQALSETTRISVRALEAFENEEWTRLPGGVFNRGFVRTIARHLDIDEDALVSAYVSATNDQPRLRSLVTDAPAGPRRVVWIAAGAAVLAAALAAGGWAAYQHFRSEPPAHDAHPPAQATFAPPR